MHWWWNHGWGMGWMMLIWPILFLLVVAWLWYLLARSSRGAEDSPEALLKRRYAKGEIDREEYERRLRDLRQ